MHIFNHLYCYQTIAQLDQNTLVHNKKFQILRFKQKIIDSWLKVRLCNVDWVGEH